MSNLSSVIDYCRIINGSKGFNDTKTQFINEMVNDYDEAHENAIYRFNVLINTIDAKDVYVNNSTTSIKGIVDTKKKQTATSDMEESLQVYPNMIKQGDYVKFKMNDTDTLQDYIVTSPIEKKHGYDEGVFIKCNQILKWKDKDNVIREFPCVLENNSYGVKVMADNDYTKNQNIKADIKVQYNEITKDLSENMRFMFSQSKHDIYKVINVDTAMDKGIITLTTEKSLYQAEDDIENMIAFCDSETPSTPVTPPTPTTSYIINGLDSIKQLVNSTYVISPLTKCTFSLGKLDNLCGEIISDDGKGTCVVQGKSSRTNETITLTAKDTNGNVLASKVITTTRK